MSPPYTIELDPKIHERLLKEAAEVDVPLAQIVDDILALFLNDGDSSERTCEHDFYLVPIRSAIYKRLEKVADRWIACECHHGDVSFLINKMLDTTSVCPEKGITLEIPFDQRLS